MNTYLFTLLLIYFEWQKKKKTKQLARPSATGASAGPTGTHIPIPPQYVFNGYQYSASAPSAASLANGQQQNYQPNAGLNIYQAHGFGVQQSHLAPPSTAGHSIHLQPPGPPGPSALTLPSLVGHGKVNGNSHNAFVTYKEVNPLRVSILRKLETFTHIHHKCCIHFIQ